jgi:hypothetical protein
MTICDRLRAEPRPVWRERRLDRRVSASRARAIARLPVLQENLETYLARQKEKGRDVPKFVERELRGVLECGVLACGFLRLQCELCKEEKLLPFSCKGRAACSSCCGRRMADTAAHLVDHVFPRVPVRQWVLSLHFSLRYRLAYSPSLLTAVYGIFARTVFSFLRKMGRDYGIHQTQCGAVSFVQRYGGSLNLNVHIHMACIDGVYAPDVDGRPRFYALRRLEDKDIPQLTQTLASQITALVQHRFGESCGEKTRCRASNRGWLDFMRLRSRTGLPTAPMPAGASCWPETGSIPRGLKKDPLHCAPAWTASISTRP